MISVHGNIHLPSLIKKKVHDIALAAYLKSQSLSVYYINISKKKRKHKHIVYTQVWVFYFIIHVDTKKQDTHISYLKNLHLGIIIKWHDDRHKFLMMLDTNGRTFEPLSSTVL